MIEPKVVTAPVTMPVSLDEAKLHLSIESTITEWDALLTLYIDAARDYFESRTASTVHDTEYDYLPTCWPCSDRIVLPRATPLIEIGSVVLTDSTGAQTTWSDTEYLADTDSIPGALVLGYGQSWPSFTPSPVSPIRITYRAGIDTASPMVAAPARIKYPCLLLVAGMFENRESVVVSDKNIVAQIAVQYGVEDWIARNLAEFVC